MFASRSLPAKLKITRSTVYKAGDETWHGLPPVKAQGGIGATSQVFKRTNDRQCRKTMHNQALVLIMAAGQWFQEFGLEILPRK